MSQKRKHAFEEDDLQTGTSTNGHKRRTDFFQILKIDNYKKPPSHDTSVKIGEFSTDFQNEFCDNRHQLRYLSLPDNLTGLNINLNADFHKYKDTYEDRENSFIKVLRWIVAHKGEIKNIFPGESSFKNSSKAGTSKEDLSKGRIDFICTRQVLISIFSTLYEENKKSTKDSERRSEWLIQATKFRSVIYLRRVQSKKESKEEESRNEETRKMISMGYKFENCITSDSEDSQPDTTRTVNVNQQYYVVLKTKLDDLGTLFSAEMDAVDPEVSNKNPADMNRFVEIKTNYILNSENRKRSFRSKFLKWYLQCFLAGVPRVICGFRDTKGFVKEIKKYNVVDLPKEAKDTFDPAVCLKFGHNFLDYVKRKMSAVKDGPEVAYEFYWKPGEREVTCEELKEAFLPDWYIKEMLST